METVAGEASTAAEFWLSAVRRATPMHSKVGLLNRINGSREWRDYQRGLCVSILERCGVAVGTDVATCVMWKPGLPL